MTLAKIRSHRSHAPGKRHLRSPSLRSRYSVKNKDELKAAVEALPAYTQKTTAPQKELFTVTAAILPK